MRIGIISEYFYPDDSGGTPSELSDLLRFLASNYGDLDIDVLTSQNLYRPSGVQTELPGRETWAGIRILRLPTPRSNRPSMALRLAAGTVFSATALLVLLFRRRYDLLLIVTNPPANGMLAWVYWRLRRVPYVYLVHDLYPDIAEAMGKISNGSIAFKLLAGFQKRWLNAAARVVALGRCMGAHLQRRYDVAPETIEVIASWADPRAFHPAVKLNDFRRRHELNGFVATYAGNFSRYVNFDQILGAARLLKNTEEIKFVLIGDGARRAEIEKRVANESLSNVVVLPPVPRSAIPEVLGAADASLISLAPKMVGLGVPSKLYPILAAGRPVLGMVPEESEVGRVIQEENCGLNVPDGDAEALAEALWRLYASPQLAVAMGNNARSALERRFTITHAAGHFHRVFQEIASTALHTQSRVPQHDSQRRATSV